MLCSLFSVFDPTCDFFVLSGQLKWLMVLTFVFFSSWHYYLVPSGFPLLLDVLSNLIMNMVKITFETRYKGVLVIVIAVFIMLFIIGESGMSPYVFTSSSSLSFNLSLALPLWLGGFIYMFILQWKSAISHFVPMGCPPLLVPFLVLVETLSNFIRPFSLSVRLLANIMAGHILVVLLSSIISSLFSNPAYIVLIFIQCGLLMFEMGVALIQSYVFVSLLHLYWKENLMN